MDAVLVHPVREHEMVSALAVLVIRNVAQVAHVNRAKHDRAVCQRRPQFVQRCCLAVFTCMFGPLEAEDLQRFTDTAIGSGAKIAKPERGAGLLHLGAKSNSREHFDAPGRDMLPGRSQ